MLKLSATAALGLILSAGLMGSALMPPGAQAQDISSPFCETFESCLRKALLSQDPPSKILAAGKGIEFYTKKLPLRDLYNLYMIRTDALIETYQKLPSEQVLSQAEDDYRTMLGMRPEDWFPQSGLARIAELRGRQDEAESFHNTAVQSGDFIAYMNRSAWQLRRQDPAASLADLEVAARIVSELQARERDIHPAHLLRLQRLLFDSLMGLQRQSDALVALRNVCKFGDRKACIDVRRYERWSFF